MNTACLKGYLDCSCLGQTENDKKNKDYQKKDTLLRSGLLVISFAIFSVLIAPDVQRTLPGRESVAYVSQSGQVNIRSGLPVNAKVKSDKAAKAVLVLSLIGSQGN